MYSPKVSLSQYLLSCILLSLGVVMLFVLYVLKDVGGDIGDIIWRFNLIKVHLSSEWTMPYYTPGRVGGFLLAADAQDFLFSVYMLVHIIIPNVIWAVKITNLLLTIGLGTGMYVWLGCFGVENSTARVFSSILVCICGYWVMHLSTASHIWAHGIAYTPWIMVLVEYLLAERVGYEGRYILRVLGLAGLLFLLINSGYYWLQVTLPILLMRCVVEVLSAGRRIIESVKRLGVVIFSGVFAIVLSGPRLAGIYEFQITKFPRMGGVVPHYQVIGDTKYLLEMLVRSFFDANIILNSVHSEMLGGFYEYTNFIGGMAAFPLIFGLLGLKRILKSKTFWGLFLAAFSQVILVRTTHWGDLIREAIPLLKQITWHWRGSATLIFISCLLIAVGYESLLKYRHVLRRVFVLAFMILNFSEIIYVYAHFQKLNFSPQPPLVQIFQGADLPSRPLEKHYVHSSLANIYGYGNSFPPQLSYDPHLPVSESPLEGYYNLHDVRRLAGQEADQGYFLTHDWPLWPKEDQKEFERFVNYRQVIEIPLYLKTINGASILGWLIYLASIGFIIVKNLKKNNDYPLNP